MNLVAEYDDIESNGDENTDIKPKKQLMKLNCAPNVDFGKNSKNYVKPGTNILSYNATLEELSAPIMGPPKPGDSEINAKTKNTHTGYAEPIEIESYHFDENYNTFYNFGYSVAPDGKKMIGSVKNLIKYGGKTAATTSILTKPNIPKRRKLASGKAEDVDGFQGPWAPFEGDDDELEKPVFEVKQVPKESELKVEKTEKITPGLSPEECTATFYGEKEVDYQGRSWILPPLGLKPREISHSFIPKKCVATFEGHSKGVQILRMIPISGHLVLSGSLDNKVKIFDIFTQKACMQLYEGHLAAIKDINFNFTGRHFVSASLDSTAKIWDTETGKCITSISPGSVPYSSTFYPKDENIVLIGYNNHKILQYDTRSNEKIQSYENHNGAVNQILFYDNGDKFISSSDDKQIISWDYNMPVPTTYITDNEISNIPTLTAHPNGHTILGTSMDESKIITLGCKTNIHLNNRKVYKGHNISGHPCQVGVSGDGNLITSGDSSGSLWFWNYKTLKVIKRLPSAHKGPLVGVVWHPWENKMVTCGWDGFVKLWE